MITRKLIERIHQGAYIRRWNDHIRPDQGFFELDKQAHKMMIAFFLAKIEEHIYKKTIDYQNLIEGGISQYFHRVELTDIKPPIFHRLMKECGKELNAYVIKQCKKDFSLLKDQDFLRRFNHHLEEDLKKENELSLEHRILAAAHYLATQWEFDLIYITNTTLYGIEETKKEVEQKLSDYTAMDSVSYILQNKGYNHLFNLIGQLRFQRRWTQTVRIPETSVMGHSLIVAILAYFVSIERDLHTKNQAIHHFWLGLFHDIPEVLTRDIISPVKRSVSELDQLIKQIEQEELHQKVRKLFPSTTQDEKVATAFFWYIETEFQNTSFPDNTSILFGDMVKHCDLYAAYVEASLSLFHGISSPSLEAARRHIEQQLSSVSYDDFHWQLLLDYFR